MKKALALLAIISVVYGVSAQQVEYKYINKLPKGVEPRRSCDLVNKYPNQLELKKVCDEIENGYIFYAQQLRQSINDGLKKDIEKNFNNPEKLELFFQSTDWQNVKKDLIREEVKAKTKELDVTSEKHKQMKNITCFFLDRINREEWTQFEQDMISAQR